MKNFNLKQYTEEAEGDFSGFYGEQFGEFAEDMDNADGAAAAQPMGVVTPPTPYQFNVTNSTGGTLNAILFGRNKYLQSTNYGSPTGITITPSATNISYLMLLMQSAEQPFEATFMRVTSSSNVQATQAITVTNFDANGQSCDIPLFGNAFFSPNQYQSGIVDIPLTGIKFDGNTYLTYPIITGLTGGVTITIFPKTKINTSRPLSGQPMLRTYGKPVVAIGVPNYQVRN